MGSGALSKQAEVKHTWVTEYRCWDASSINAAADRWRLRGSPVAVNRAEWFDIFNDYSVIGAGGHYLTVDLEQFNLCRVLDGDPNTASVAFVFLLLALLGGGDVGQRASLIFAMFCKDGADVLDRDGAQRLTGHLKQAVALVGLQAAGAPGAAELARLFFPGGQGRADTIDCKTFVDLWNSKRHIMLHAIQHGAIVEPEHAEARQSLSEATSRKKPAAVGRNLDPARSLARRERAQLRFSTRNAARAKEDVMRKDQEKYAGHNAGKLILSDKAKEANHKMMLQRVNKVATQKVMLELMETTQLSYADLSEIRAEFAFAFADRWKAEPLPVSETGAPKHAFRVQHAPGPAETRKPGLTMSMGRLKRILLARFPQVDDGRLLDRLAQVFDGDGSGDIDFVEFVTGVAKVIASRHDGEALLEFLFSLFDKNGDGDVELWEICDLVEMAHDDLLDLWKYAAHKSKSLDVRGDGMIILKDFERILQQDPIYRDFLWSSLAPLPPRLTELVLPIILEAMEASASERLSLFQPTTVIDASKVQKMTVSLLLEARKDLLGFTQGHHPCDLDRCWASLQKAFGDNHFDGVILEHFEAIFAYFASGFFGNSVDQRKKLGLKSRGAHFSGSEQQAGSASRLAAGSASRRFLNSAPPEDDLSEFAANRAAYDALYHVGTTGARCNPRDPWGVLMRACARDCDKATTLTAMVAEDCSSDADNGDITLVKVTTFLRDIKDMGDSLSANAVRLLDDLDASGDGKLQMDELKGLVFENPSILHCISSLHMYDDVKLVEKARNNRQHKKAVIGAGKASKAAAAQSKAAAAQAALSAKGLVGSASAPVF